MVRLNGKKSTIIKTNELRCIVTGVMRNFKFVNIRPFRPSNQAKLDPFPNSDNPLAHRLNPKPLPGLFTGFHDNSNTPSFYQLLLYQFLSRSCRVDIQQIFDSSILPAHIWPASPGFYIVPAASDIWRNSFQGKKHKRLKMR